MVALSLPALFKRYHDTKQRAAEKERRGALLQRVATQNGSTAASASSTVLSNGGDSSNKQRHRGIKGKPLSGRELRRELYQLLLEHVDDLFISVSTHTQTQSTPPATTSTQCDEEVHADAGSTPQFHAAAVLEWGELGDAEEGLSDDQLEDFCLGIKDQV